MRRSSCLLVAAVLLCGLLLALDRGAAWAAGRLATSRVEAAGAEQAAVELHGFPFLTQVARRDAQRVTLTARAASRGGVRVQSVSAELREVRPVSLAGVRAGEVRVRGTVPFAELESYAGLRAGSLTTAGPTSVRVRGDVEVLGQGVPAVVTAAVALDGSDIVVTPRSLEVDGVPGSDALLRVVRERFTVRLPVPALPEGVRLSGLRVLPDGVRVDAAGSDVLLSRGSLD